MSGDAARFAGSTGAAATEPEPGWINSDIKEAPGDRHQRATSSRGCRWPTTASTTSVSIHALPELAYRDLVPALEELRRVLQAGRRAAARAARPRPGHPTPICSGDATTSCPRRGARMLGSKFVVQMIWYGYSRTLFTHDFIDEQLHAGRLQRSPALRLRADRGPFPRSSSSTTDPRRASLSRPTSSSWRSSASRTLPRDESHAGLATCGLPTARRATSTPRELPLRGWVLPATTPATAIEVVASAMPSSTGRADRSSAPGHRRGASRHAHAARCGFERASTCSPSRRVELAVRTAVVGSLRRVPLATLDVAPTAGRRRDPSSPSSSPASTRRTSSATRSRACSPRPTPRSRWSWSTTARGTTRSRSRPATRASATSARRTRGLAAARNTGLAQVDAGFVVFLDSDDRLMPEAIERGLRELEREPDAMMAAGVWRLIGEDGQVLPSSPPQQPENVYSALLESCFISTPAAVIYRRELFAEIGGFDPEVSASADYDLYLRAASRHPVCLHDDVVAEYRRHGANMTRDSQLIIRSELQVLRRQSRRVKGVPVLNEALERGIERSRTYHGARIVDEIRRQVDEGRRRDAVRTAAALGHLYPRGRPGGDPGAGKGRLALKASVGDLAVMGGRPAFSRPLYVGRPNIGDRAEILRGMGEVLDSRWLTQRRREAAGVRGSALGGDGRAPLRRHLQRDPRPADRDAGAGSRGRGRAAVLHLHRHRPRGRLGAAAAGLRRRRTGDPVHGPRAGGREDRRPRPAPCSASTSGVAPATSRASSGWPGSASCR